LELSKSERFTILTWISDGAPRGRAALCPQRGRTNPRPTTVRHWRHLERDNVVCGGRKAFGTASDRLVIFACFRAYAAWPRTGSLKAIPRDCANPGRTVEFRARCRWSNKCRVQILPRSGPTRSCPAIANQLEHASLMRLRTWVVVVGVFRKARERRGFF
jgi:hypothetical protein